jgi:hypothetical protein
MPWINVERVRFSYFLLSLHNFSLPLTLLITNVTRLYFGKHIFCVCILRNFTYPFATGVYLLLIQTFYVNSRFSCAAGSNVRFSWNTTHITISQIIISRISLNILNAWKSFTQNHTIQQALYMAVCPQAWPRTLHTLCSLYEQKNISLCWQSDWPHKSSIRSVRGVRSAVWPVTLSIQGDIFLFV